MSIRDKFLESATTFDVVPFEDVFIRPLKKSVYSQAEKIISDDNRTAAKNTELRWIVLRWGLVEESGEEVLTNDDKKEFENWNQAVVEPIFEEIFKISKVKDEDREQFVKN